LIARDPDPTSSAQTSTILAYLAVENQPISPLNSTSLNPTCSISVFLSNHLLLCDVPHLSPQFPASTFYLLDIQPDNNNNPSLVITNTFTAPSSSPVINGFSAIRPVALHSSGHSIFVVPSQATTKNDIAYVFTIGVNSTSLEFVGQISVMSGSTILNFAAANNYLFISTSLGSMV
jgi:hypothetical protein